LPKKSHKHPDHSELRSALCRQVVPCFLRSRSRTWQTWIQAARSPPATSETMMTHKNVTGVINNNRF